MRTLSVPNKIMKRVRAKGRGTVFTPADVLDCGSRAAVDQALLRLTKTGKLRKLGRGLYDFPKQHPSLGALSPAPDDVAQALARMTGSVVQITGAQAANALGLSTQVPAKSTYLTDGPSRRVVLGKRVVHLRHAAPKHLVAPGGPAGAVIQALRYLGPSRASDVAKVASRALSSQDKMRLDRSAKRAPGWMRPTLASIAAG